MTPLTNHWGSGWAALAVSRRLALGATTPFLHCQAARPANFGSRACCVLWLNAFGKNARPSEPRTKRTRGVSGQDRAGLLLREYAPCAARNMPHSFRTLLAEVEGEQGVRETASGIRQRASRTSRPPRA